MSTKRSDYWFELPPERIAQAPVDGERDASRLLHLHKESGAVEHHSFRDILDILEPGDVIVFNNSKVIPARLHGTKHETGGAVEVFLLHPLEDGESWEVMLGGKRLSEGLRIDTGSFYWTIGERLSNSTWRALPSLTGDALRQALDDSGSIPIPPYIKESPLNEDQLREQYQTVYAQEEGSVAAPTAGLHFTERLLKELDERGIERVEITLHVGLGTFAPVKADDVRDHSMHSEYAQISAEAAKQINRGKEDGRRIIAVGTTSVRTLESFAQDGRVYAGGDWTDIFIAPGYEFQIIDGLITNFHLPESTLLMLVSALAGRESILNAYQKAIQEEYRFYSFGDAMLIL